MPCFCFPQSSKSNLIKIIKNNLNAEISKTNINYDNDTFGIERVNEFKTLFLTSVKLYQTLISSQDNSVCNFTPSCSRFSSLAIRRTSFLKGLMLTSDRLQRCNGSAYHNRVYKFNLASKNFLDPVDNYIK